MPFLGYAQLAELIGKSEQEVRADRQERLFDLDNFESIVRYSARQWGWTPPETQTTKPAPGKDPYLERMRFQRGG